MAKVRILMIGVGGMGRVHIQNLLKLQDAEIVGLVDPSSESIQATKSQCNALADVQTFSDYKQALREVSADAAVIVTPHSQHFEQGWACLDAGLHVLMEKPFVAGSENAKNIIAHAERHNKHLVVGYQRHTQGPYIYLRHLIQNGELGDIHFISAYQAQSWLEICRGSWRQNPDLSCGGQLNDSGSHLLDAILWVTGLKPEEVRAYINNHGTRVDIDTALTVRFQGGAMATFNVVGSATIDWWEDVSIHGNKGTALYRNGKLFVSTGLNTPLVEIPDCELEDSSDPDENFVELILGSIDHAAAPAECGYQVARLTEAAWQSAESQQSVRL